MIGRVTIGKSMHGCLGYCLDKKLAELLDQHMCGGTKQEMLDQMREVREMNMKVEKPVQHISLSMAPGEKLSRADLIALSEECARELGFEKNQYVVIQHHDTPHQHIHIVTNRVGFDRRTLSDSHNYKTLAEFCQKMEQKFKLKEVLLPRRYQSPAERQLPRSNERKQKLRSNITEALWKADSYEEFEQLMKLKGYDTKKARGIAFIEKQRVGIKGSEVGYPRQKIETILENKLQMQVVRQKHSRLLSQKPSMG